MAKRYTNINCTRFPVKSPATEQELKEFLGLDKPGFQRLLDMRAIREEGLELPAEAKLIAASTAAAPPGVDLSKLNDPDYLEWLAEKARSDRRREAAMRDMAHEADGTKNPNAPRVFHGVDLPKPEDLKPSAVDHDGTVKTLGEIGYGPDGSKQPTADELDLELLENLTRPDGPNPGETPIAVTTPDAEQLPPEVKTEEARKDETQHQPRTNTGRKNKGA